MHIDLTCQYISSVTLTLKSIVVVIHLPETNCSSWAPFTALCSDSRNTALQPYRFRVQEDKRFTGITSCCGLEREKSEINNMSFHALWLKFLMDFNRYPCILPGWSEMIIFSSIYLWVNFFFTSAKEDIFSLSLFFFTLNMLVDVEKRTIVKLFPKNHL